MKHGLTLRFALFVSRGMTSGPKSRVTTTLRRSDIAGSSARWDAMDERREPAWDEDAETGVEDAGCGMPDAQIAVQGAESRRRAAARRGPNRGHV